jgi:hypothetical protein
MKLPAEIIIPTSKLTRYLLVPRLKSDKSICHAVSIEGQIMMTPDLYTDVALNRDIPEAGLRCGTVAAFIDRVPHPQGGEDGAILEVFSVTGDTLAVVTVPLSSIEALRDNDLFSVQRLTVR